MHSRCAPLLTACALGLGPPTPWLQSGRPVTLRHGPTQAAKLSKKTGFKDCKSLGKAQNSFAAFFKHPKPAAASSPSASPSAQQQSQQEQQQQGTPQGSLLHTGTGSGREGSCGGPKGVTRWGALLVPAMQQQVVLRAPRVHGSRLLNTSCHLVPAPQPPGPGR